MDTNVKLEKWADDDRWAANELIFARLPAELAPLGIAATTSRRGLLGVMLASGDDEQLWLDFSPRTGRLRLSRPHDHPSTAVDLDLVYVAPLRGTWGVEGGLCAVVQALLDASGVVRARGSGPVGSMRPMGQRERFVVPGSPR